MNRKELACAAVGAVLGAAGCSPAMKSLAIPAANADEAASTSLPSVVKNVPHLVEAHVSLVSGTAQDIGSVIFRLAPDKGWSIISSDPRLEVSIKRGSVAEILAPEDEKVKFVATVTISHTDGTEFLLRCHVEASCTS